MGKKLAESVISSTFNHENIHIIVDDHPDKFLVANFLRYSSGGVLRLAFLPEPLRSQYEYIIWYTSFNYKVSKSDAIGNAYYFT